VNNSNDHDDYEAQRERMREQLADNPDALAWALDSIDRDERMTRDAPPLRPCPDWCRHPYPENHGWEYTAADEYIRDHVIEVAAGVWVAAREQFLDGAYLLDPPSIGQSVDVETCASYDLDGARKTARALLAAADALAALTPAQGPG
jgi:hypothetical protein